MGAHGYVHPRSRLRSDAAHVPLQPALSPVHQHAPRGPAWHGALLALFVLRERSRLNLALLYTFATGEGITLGLLLQSYVAHGLGAS
jgi:hypothetical protein